MRLEEALAASSHDAAAIPAVEDIIYFRDGRTYWWTGTTYVLRRAPGKHVLESDGWHPFEDIEVIPKD